MPHTRYLTIIAATMLLAACASPSVDSSAPSFDETKYAVDLDDCRGGTVLGIALKGLAGVAAGSALGLVHVASIDGAIIGAIVGGVAGAFVGAYEPIQEQEQSVERCLSGKGYVVGS